MENPDFQSVFFWFPYEKRYQKIPIWGKPVVFKHGRPHVLLLTWLGTYSALTPGVLCADNATVRLGADNELQPDALLRL